MKYLNSGWISDLFGKKIVKICPLIAKLGLSKSPIFKKCPKFFIDNSPNMSDLEFFFLNRLVFKPRVQILGDPQGLV